MNTSKAGKALPIILAAITIATAIFFWNQRETLRQKTEDLLARTNKISLKLPEPTPFVPVKQYKFETVTPTPTLVVTPTPTVVQTSKKEVKEESTTTLKPGLQKTVSSQSVTKTEIICTPVYGMANSCAEHAVVDTALDTTIFYNLAGLSYFAGLAAFVKAKKRS